MPNELSKECMETFKSIQGELQTQITKEKQEAEKKIL